MNFFLIISIQVAFSTSKINLNGNTDLDSQIIFIDNEYDVVQTIENGKVQLKLDNIDVQKYITAEISIIYPEDKIDFQFSCTKISQNEKNDYVETFIDNNGYALKKKQYIISIPPNTYQITDSLYFYMNITSQNLTYQYILNVRNTQNYQCLNQCNSGLCLQEQKICQCPKGLLDLDCSVVGINLPLNSVQNISPKLNRNTFLYYQPTQEENQIKIEIETLGNYLFQEIFISIYIMIENKDYGLPTNFHNDLQFFLSNLQSKKSLIFDLNSLKYDDQLQRQPKIIIAIVNPFNFNTQFKVLVEKFEPISQSSFTVIFTLIGAAILVLLIIIICCICYKCRILKEKKQQNSTTNLSKQIIQQYMPSATYKEILQQLREQNNDIQPNEQCSVCLENFELISFCRATPCQHIFHSKCLVEWLQKNQNCPLCREKLTFVALQTRNREDHIGLISQD